MAKGKATLPMTISSETNPRARLNSNRSAIKEIKSDYKKSSEYIMSIMYHHLNSPILLLMDGDKD